MTDNSDLPPNTDPTEGVTVEELEFADRGPSPVENLKLNRSQNTKLQLKLAGLGVVVFMIAGLMIWKKDWIVQQPQIRPFIPVALLASPEPSPSPAESPTPVPTATPGPYMNPTFATQEQFILQHKDANGEFRDLASIHPEEAVRWKDTLIFQNKGNQKALEIIKLNLLTNQITPVATMSSETYDYPGIENGLSDLGVIGDDLYISLQGYAKVIGGTYWISLTSETTPKKVADTSNATLEKKDDRYFLRGGFGDGCGGVGHIFVLNPDTHVARKLLQTEEGCVDGESVVGQDEKNVYIANHHQVEGITIDPSTIFTDVSQVNIDTGARSILIAPEQMPEKVVDINVYPKENKMLLLGPAVNLFDLGSKTMEKIHQWDEPSVSVSVMKTLEDGVCLRTSYPDPDKQDIFKYYELNFTAKTVSEGGSNCLVASPAPDALGPQGIIDRNKELLNLPDTYRIVNQLPQ